MNSFAQTGTSDSDKTANNIAYLRQMLAELRLVAKGEGADMLCYLIEMAYVEAGDLQAGRSRLGVKARKSRGD